jgi:tRNA A-37 threonylcarbamoyl transferase component Bud32
VLKIRRHLDLYNQLVPHTQSLFEKTFNNPTPDNREALVTNLEKGYRSAGRRAEIIVQEIADLQKRYGSAK